MVCRLIVKSALCRVSKTENGITTNYTYNNLNQLTSSGYSYDSVGNQTSNPGFTFEYDNRNRLIMATRNSQTTYTYDSDGRRTSKTVNGATAYYQYKDNDIIAEYDANGNQTVSYSLDPTGRILNLKKQDTIYYFNYNGHGDVVSLTDTSGNIVASYKYDTWGNPKEYNSAGTEVSIGTAGNYFLYAGYQYDSETGLYYLKARYYDPKTARFMSRDPNASYTSRNPYIYAENNPINLVDPTGLAPTGVIRGRVENESGKPIAGAIVRVDATVIPTNTNGEFQFTLVENGIYTIHYDAAGYGSQVQEGIAVTGTTITPTVFMSPNWSNAIGQPLVVKAGGRDGGYIPFSTSMALTKPDHVSLALSGTAMYAEHVGLAATSGLLFQPESLPVTGSIAGKAFTASKVISGVNFSYTFYKWSQGSANLGDVIASGATVIPFPGSATVGFGIDAYSLLR